MNWDHVRAFVWLRWRLFANRMRRGGPLGTAVSALLAGLMALGSLGMLGGGLAIGLTAVGDASFTEVMLFWDGAVVAFVFFWTIGLVAELQRSEPLSLDRFFHLPVSPSGAFLINYVGSSVSLSLLLFLPGMVGLSTGLLFSQGVRMLLLFPLILAFFVMVTALTYQFQGWLQSLMRNPRRRGTVLALLTTGFIALSFLPMLVNRSNRDRNRERPRDAQADTEAATPDATASDPAAPDADPVEAPPPAAGLSEDSELAVRARLANAVLPPGWLAYGAASILERRVVPALLGTLGMALIGLISLRRSYATTIRLYMGHSSATGARTPKRKAASSSRRRTTRLVERRLPWVSEHASAIAVATFRSHLRAPETKMMLLSPVIMLFVFTGFFGRRDGIPELLRALSATGFVAFMLILTLVGWVGNLFGFDRGAFRAHVLSPATRRDVLLAKNLALAPFALGLIVTGLAIAQWRGAMRLDHLLAVFVETVPLFLLLSLCGNVLSIVAPMTLKVGSGMPGRHQGAKLLYQILFMFVLPLPLALAAVPLGVEALLVWLGWNGPFPTALVLALMEAGLTVWLYLAVLEQQGEWLYSREQRIVQVVTARAD